MAKTVISILPHLKKTQNPETFVKFAACMPDVAPDALVEAQTTVITIFLSMKYLNILAFIMTSYSSFVTYE